MPAERLTLGIYRDLSNRLIPEPDDGPVTRAAHEKRRLALEADLDDPCLSVVNWGQTKDKEPHEYVEVVVEILKSPEVQAAAASAVAFIGGVLSKTASSLLVDGAKHLIQKLWSRMQTKEVEDFNVTFPAGSAIHIASDRKVHIRLASGESWSFEFDKPPSTTN